MSDKALSNGNLYNFVRAVDSYLADGVTMPNNTTLNGTGVKSENSNGAIEVIAYAKTDIALADTTTLTIKVQDSADDVTYADLDTLYTKTASGAETIDAGTILGRYVLAPDDDIYVRSSITTDDTQESGTIDVFLHYLSR